MTGVGCHVFLQDLPDPDIELTSPALTGGFFTSEPPRKPFSGLTYVKVRRLMTGMRFKPLLKPLLTVLAFTLTQRGHLIVTFDSPSTRFHAWWFSARLCIQSTMQTVLQNTNPRSCWIRISRSKPSNADKYYRLICSVDADKKSVLRTSKQPETEAPLLLNRWPDRRRLHNDTFPAHGHGDVDN